MLKFINKSDYQKPNFEQLSPAQIVWNYQDEKGCNHSGLFILGQKSNHLRDDEEFEPFAEVLELGLVPEFDQAAYDAKIANEQKEGRRLSLKAKRDRDLQSIVHKFSDDLIAQVRPQDIANFQIAISKGKDTEWIMEDNSVAELTLDELKMALNSGIEQGEIIYRDYMQALKAL